MFVILRFHGPRVERTLCSYMTWPGPDKEGMRLIVIGPLLTGCVPKTSLFYIYNLLIL